MSFEYKHIIFNTIINALIEGAVQTDREKKLGLHFNELYEKCKEIFRRSGLDYTPSKTDFSNHIKKMVEDNVLRKTRDESSKLMIKPEYYSLTDDAKKRRHLNLLSIGHQQQRLRKIYEKLLFWEFFHTRPIPIRSEQKVEEFITKLKQQLDPSNISNLDWERHTDATNDFLRYEVGSSEYLEHWDEEIPEMKILYIDYFYHVTATPKIFFTKREYWEATKRSKNILFAKYILNLPGVSKEEFLSYHNRFSEVKFTDKEIEEAFLLLKNSGLIKPHLVLGNEIRYVMTDDRLLELIKTISGIFEQEMIILMSKWRYFEKPTEEEKKRLRWMFGEDYARRVIQSAEINMHENKKAIKNCKNIVEYSEFLRKNLKDFPRGGS